MNTEPERPEIVEVADPSDADKPSEVIEQPAKIMRIGSMIKQLLEEVRGSELDEASRDRIRDIYDMSINELAATLSPDLREELGRLAIPFTDEGSAPSGAELRVAQAQLVGWLEGLFQGIQATMFAQQMMARQQLEQMRQGQLPPGAMGAQGPGGMGGRGADQRPGTYL